MKGTQTDYSKQNYSNIIVDEYEDDHYEQDLKDIKYPTHAVSSAQNLSFKIQSFRDDDIKTKLTNELKQLNSYRKIRGDGNCFFRALAFSYLSIISKTSMIQCFPYIKQINLACCYPQTIPKDFKRFYNHRFLSKMLAKYWDSYYLKYLKQSNKNSRKALLKLFSEFPFIDFIVILYFRSLCLKSLFNLQASLKQYLLGKQQKYIRTYSSETQGVCINICGIMLKLIIHVYEIRKKQVIIYHYDNVQRSIGQISLLFYQNHYDIVQKNQNIQDQKDSLSTNQYYGSVNRRKIQGRCIQCYYRGTIYEQSSVCLQCFDKIQNASKKYDRQKVGHGRCLDCGRYKDNIYQDLNICKACIQIQNKVQSEMKNSQKGKDEKNQKNQQKIQNDQSKNNKEDQDNNLKQEKSQLTIDRCFQCKRRKEIDVNTGICVQCSSNQKMALNNLQQKKKKQQFKQTKRNQYSIPNNENRKNSSPFKDTKIGTEIKPKVYQNFINNAQQINDKKNKKQEQQIMSSSGNTGFLSKYQNQIIGKCQKCKQTCNFHNKTNFCKKCYLKTFSQSGYCSKCKFKMLINSQTRKCKDCHPKQVNDEKNNSENSLCKSCNRKKERLNEIFCNQCIKKVCKKCNKPSLHSNLILGVCSFCRHRF